MEKLQDSVHIANSVRNSFTKVYLAKKELDGIESSSWLKKFIAYMRGELGNAREDLMCRVTDRDRLLHNIKSYMPGIQDEARAYDEAYEQYLDVQEHLMTELSQTAHGKFELSVWNESPMSSHSFVNEIDKIKTPFGTSLQDAAAILALVNTLKPQMDSREAPGAQLSIAGMSVVFLNGSTFPRLGFDKSKEVANDTAQRLGRTHILHIHVVSNPETAAKRTKDVYVAVSDATARIINLAKNELDTKCDTHEMFGSRWGNFTGFYEITYVVTPVEAAK